MNHSVEPLPLIDRVRHRFDKFINAVEIVGLVLIGLATTVAIAQEAWTVIKSGQVRLSDLLLMFLYLEVLAMDGRYLRLGQLPVRFPLYIAMASLARELILRVDDASDLHKLMVTGAIILLSLGVVILRFGQHRFPTTDDLGRASIRRPSTRRTAAKDPSAPNADLDAHE